MISYFYRNKGRSELNPCEDSLTAVVFDTLKYLPTSIFWDILKSALYKDKLPPDSGELKEITFWDKWNSEGTGNTNFVEPDVFLRFNDFDIIIEAKRYDKNQQSEGQISNEIQSYFNEYETEKKDLYLIKLGGLHSKSDEKNHFIRNTPICKTDWTRLLDVISKKLYDLKKEGDFLSSSYVRILEDCIHGFALHQYYKKEWFSELKPYQTINHLCLKNTFNYARKS